MDMKHLITKVHDKAGDDELMNVMLWWYDMSDMRTQQAVADKMQQVAYKITLPEAENCVKAMRPAGQHWSCKQVKEYLATKGITDRLTDYYLVMNMVYNDYQRTAQTFGLQSDVEFYFSLARDFIEDVDAKPFKIERYFECD